LLGEFCRLRKRDKKSAGVKRQQESPRMAEYHGFHCEGNTLPMRPRGA